MVDVPQFIACVAFLMIKYSGFFVLNDCILSHLIIHLFVF